MSLRRIILDEIARNGPMPFSRYMELCLYHPEFGFYSRAREQFGRAGDFYTSSDVHAVFGRLLARQFEEMWRALDQPPRLDVVELGPGRGLFARDVLDWSARKFPDFSRAVHYWLVEQSAGLRARLEERLAEHIAAGKCSVVASLGDLHAPENAILFANEFFDALPTEVVSDRGQVFVDAAGERLVETFRPPSPDLLEYLDRHSVHPEEGQRVEVSLAAQQWIECIARFLRRGFAVVVDYGYTRAEQLAGRHLDTLVTYRRHSMGADPFEAPGEQDITAHVNFTALAESARSAGLEPLAHLTQAQFLMGIGEPNEFADAFEDTVLPQERTKVALQLKHLVTPAGLGETFHALLLSKDVAKEKAAHLRGLSFSNSSITR